jgi:hypothetical protein
MRSRTRTRTWPKLLRAAPGLALIVAATSTCAQILDEVWVGGYAHSVNNSPGEKEAGTQEVEVEADTVQPGFLRGIGAPRIAITMAFNTGGKTDFGGVALAWDHQLYRHLVGSLQFGLNGNDGDVRAPLGPSGDVLRRDRLQLGSNVLFREAAGLSWRFNRRWELGAQYIHESNGEILSSGPNESLNELGLRLGYRFY